MAFVYGYRIIVLILGEPSLLTGEISISPSWNGIDYWQMRVYSREIAGTGLFSI